MSLEQIALLEKYRSICSGGGTTSTNIVTSFAQNGGAQNGTNGNTNTESSSGGGMILPGSNVGGKTSGPLPNWLLPPPSNVPVLQVLTTYTNPVTGETYTANTSGYTIINPETGLTYDGKVPDSVISNVGNVVNDTFDNLNNLI